jgi:hypothetical protein
MQPFRFISQVYLQLIIRGLNYTAPQEFLAADDLFPAQTAPSWARGTYEITCRFDRFISNGRNRRERADGTVAGGGDDEGAHIGQY